MLGWGVYLMALLEMSSEHVNSNFVGGISDVSAAHVIWTCELQFQGVYVMDIIWEFELILGFTMLHKGLFYKRPINKVSHGKYSQPRIHSKAYNSPHFSPHNNSHLAPYAMPIPISSTGIMEGHITGVARI